MLRYYHAVLDARDHAEVVAYASQLKVTNLDDNAGFVDKPFGQLYPSPRSEPKVD